MKWWVQRTRLLARNGMQLRGWKTSEWVTSPVGERQHFKKQMKVQVWWTLSFWETPVVLAVPQHWRVTCGKETILLHLVHWEWPSNPFLVCLSAKHCSKTPETGKCFSLCIRISVKTSEAEGKPKLIQAHLWLEHHQKWSPLEENLRISWWVDTYSQ
jgi:hypothetical protein